MESKPVRVPDLHVVLYEFYDRSVFLATVSTINNK